MTNDVRSSDVVRAVQEVVARPPLGRVLSSSSVRSQAMGGMVLSFDETQRVRQLRQRSSGVVPTLTTVREQHAAASPRGFTAERPTAAPQPSIWHKVWHGMACAQHSASVPTAQKPTNAGGAWVTCKPPIPIGSIDGLQSGYQVRTTQGLDMIFGVPLPTANDATELVTAYRDLSALADAQP